VSAVDEMAAPVITVVRGDPTPAELAAVVPVLLSVLLAAGPAGAPAASPQRRSMWADRARVVGVPARPGRYSWRAAGLPR
jgi:hypothetical protein